MKKNDFVNLKISDVTIEGMGVGRFENMAIFVSGAAVGDELEVKIIKVNKNYAVGKIEKILFPSKDRIEVDCKCYPKCGGCSFRHISYDAELKIKQKHVSDCLKRIGGFKELEVRDIVPCKQINFYRNKSQIPVGENGDIVAGFYGPHSHRIVDCGNCQLHPKEFGKIIEAVKFWIKKYKISVYSEENHRGLIRHIYFRCSKNADEIMLCLVINGKKLPFKEEFIKILRSTSENISGIILNINCEKTNVILGKKSVTLWGKDYIKDELCGLEFKISPLSFYQVNRSQTEKLYSLVKHQLDLPVNSVILDLYCGIGTIGLSLAGENSKVIGIEIVDEAVKNAKENAKINKIENSEFYCMDASEVSRKLKVKPNAVIIDPPRKGCVPELIKNIVDIDPEKIVYVSCNPSTLARDLKIFSEISDFKIEKVTPVDMFPRTSHVETVVIMSKI